MSAGQRPQRSARKLNRKAALDQKARGLSTAEIASLQGVASSTVRRFLDRMKPELEAVQEFKRGRGDALAHIQGLALDVQQRLLDSMDDGYLAALTPHAKNGLLQSVNTVFGTTFDKERLETGKSTQNVSLISKMMGDALETAFTDEPATESGQDEAHEPNS